PFQLPLVAWACTHARAWSGSRTGNDPMQEGVSTSDHSPEKDTPSARKSNRLSRHARRPATLAAAATTLLARLLVIRHPLDVLRQPFLLAHLLKTPQHLLGGLVTAGLHLDHERILSS